MTKTIQLTLSWVSTYILVIFFIYFDQSLTEQSSRTIIDLVGYGFCASLFIAIWLSSANVHRKLKAKVNSKIGLLLLKAVTFLVTPFILAVFFRIFSHRDR